MSLQQCPRHTKNDFFADGSSCALASALIFVPYFVASTTLIVGAPELSTLEVGTTACSGALFSPIIDSHSSKSEGRRAGSGKFDGVGQRVKASASATQAEELD